MGLKELKSELKGKVSRYIDTRVYDETEWAERGESVGRGSSLTLISEGELNHLLNGHARAFPGDLTGQGLQELAGRHGYYVEQGFSWSWHFYPVPA